MISLRSSDRDHELVPVRHGYHEQYRWLCSDVAAIGPYQNAHRVVDTKQE
jgi:hypothetical protein